MSVAVIRYNAGNVQSVRYALERLGIDFVVTDEPDQIRSADKVIFPGVGEASTTMRYLREKRLDNVITGLKQPVLGICLGMQLMCRQSDENNTPCLGIFDETVRRFNGPLLKVPHMGWNTLTDVSGWVPPELKDQFVYFVHSYFVPVCSFTTAKCEYGTPFSAALQKDNFYAVQFHPEKSSRAGETILEAFLKL